MINLNINDNSSYSDEEDILPTIDYYNEDNLFVQSEESLHFEEGIENLHALSLSGYKLNRSQREHLICMDIDPDTFENLNEAEKEDFIQDSSQ